MQVVGFHAPQVCQGIYQRGATKRQGERMPGLLCLGTVAKNLVNRNTRDLGGCSRWRPRIGCSVSGRPWGESPLAGNGGAASCSSRPETRSSCLPKSYYGIFHMAEYTLPIEVNIKECRFGIGTRPQILDKYGLTAYCWAYIRISGEWIAGVGSHSSCRFNFLRSEFFGTIPQLPRRDGTSLTERRRFACLWESPPAALMSRRGRD
jgi:hypothetical protein